MEIQKQMKERESVKKVRHWANRKCYETTFEEKVRREREAQKKETRSTETPLQAETRRRHNSINMAENELWKDHQRQMPGEDKMHPIWQKNGIWKHHQRQMPGDNTKRIQYGRKTEYGDTIRGRCHEKTNCIKYGREMNYGNATTNINPKFYKCPKTGSSSQKNMERNLFADFC
jgi:hypothetical protein